MQSCIPKILDKYITKLLYEYLGDTISPNQHGFMKGRGTATNLLEITQFLHDNIKDSQVDIIYLDYSKAIDHIRHDLLAAKLSKLAVPYNLYRLIMNFIIGRKYILKIDGIETTFEIMPKSSVRQGSHMGPILYYILFTNGLGLDELCYADDTKVFQIIRTLQDRDALQTKINKIEKWSSENGLTLNPNETYHVSYGKRTVHSLYFIKGQIIEEKKEARDLGVIFDSGLTFKSHIEYVNKRASQMIGAARRFVTGINIPILIARIYSVYIQPIMEYCSVVWNQHRITLNNSLNLSHKKVTRIALNIYWNMDPTRYIAYDRRCEVLNQDGPLVRRSTQAAITCTKIIKGELRLTFSQIIQNNLNQNTNARVFHLLNRTNRFIPPKSPIAMMLAAARTYERVIDLNLEMVTISNKIKEFNTVQRTRLADSRRSTGTYV